jgi:hypothetical protein
MHDIYHSIPLITQTGDLRLITIRPKSGASTHIECEMQKCCLADTCDEYDTFAKDGSYSHSELLPAWHALQMPTPQPPPDIPKVSRYPENAASRFR